MTIRERAEAWRQHAARAEESRSSARPGTATGIAALISTMAHRWARSPTVNAASIPSRNPGPSFRAPRNRRVPRAPWRRSTNISCAATISCRCCSRRPSIIRRPIPAISKAIRREFARTAGNIPMARSGRRWPSPCRAMATRRANCCRCSTRSTTPTAPPAFTATRSSPMSSAPIVYSDAAACRARRLDLVHRLGRLDVSRGARVASRLSVAGQQSGARSLHSPQLAGIRNRIPLSLRAL